MIEESKSESALENGQDEEIQTMILLRHAKAISRKDWVGDDLDRPLDSLGELQAKRLVASLAPLGVAEIHSSSAVRCYETINPLARALSLDYFFTDSLSEFIYSKHPERTYKYIDRLLENDSVTLVCSHNPILPNYLSWKLDRQGFSVPETKLAPGDAWVVKHVAKEILAVEHIPAPAIA